jgi:hypothetical protein
LQHPRGGMPQHPAPHAHIHPSACIFQRAARVAATRVLLSDATRLRSKCSSRPWPHSSLRRVGWLGSCASRAKPSRSRALKSPQRAVSHFCQHSVRAGSCDPNTQLTRRRTMPNATVRAFALPGRARSDSHGWSRRAQPALPLPAAGPGRPSRPTAGPCGLCACSTPGGEQLGAISPATREMREGASIARLPSPTLTRLAAAAQVPAARVGPGDIPQVDDGGICPLPRPAGGRRPRRRYAQQVTGSSSRQQQPGVRARAGCCRLPESKRVREQHSGAFGKTAFAKRRPRSTAQRQLVSISPTPAF